MAQLPESLIPGPGDRGLGTCAPTVLVEAVARSWELFVALAEPLDLDAVTRAKGLTVREILIPLGAWDDNRPLAQLLRDARAGVVGEHDQGALVDEVRERHRHERDSDILDALRLQHEQMIGFVQAGDEDGLWGSPVASMLGTLPLVTYLMAATYPLATSALDLESAGAHVPDGLLDNGVLGVIDTIGALAARQGVTASLTAVTPTVVAGTGAQSGAWTPRLLDDGPAAAPSVHGTSRVLLEVVAGRANVPEALGRRELSVSDAPGLLALAPVIEQVPGIPGRMALVAAIRTTTAISGVLRRLPFGLGRPG